MSPLSFYGIRSVNLLLNRTQGVGLHKKGAEQLISQDRQAGAHQETGSRSGTAVTIDATAVPSLEANSTAAYGGRTIVGQLD